MSASAALLAADRVDDAAARLRQAYRAGPIGPLRDIIDAADVDSRFLDWKITIADTIADNASSAFFVLGGEPKSLAGLDLVTCGMALSMDGTVVSLGASVACMGHPLNAVEWLARALAARGEPLRAGDVVMSGALGPMTALTPGAYVRVEIGGLGSAEFLYREA